MLPVPEQLLNRKTTKAASTARMIRRLIHLRRFLDAGDLILGFCAVSRVGVTAASAVGSCLTTVCSMLPTPLRMGYVPFPMPLYDTRER